MSILVANYGGSSSESDSEEDEAVVEIADSKPKATCGVNLLTSTNTDSDDDSDEDGKLSLLPRSLQPKIKPREILKEESKSKLPLPSFMTQTPTFSSPAQTISTKSASTSVFTNQFETAEQQKLSILEQHVKLSSTEKTEAEMGKKICWMFRKGRCRFGHKCKFAHDNDISLKQAGHGEDEQVQTHDDGGGYQTDSSKRASGFGEQHQRQQFQQQQQGYFQSGFEGGDNAVEDADQFQMRKRKKPGLAQGLVPPKRSMTAYQRQASQERPWTKN